MDYNVSPPIRPHLDNPLDTSNFYPIADDESVLAYNSKGMDHEAVWEKEFPYAI